MLKLLIDYDGTLTAEELQVAEVARLSLRDLAESILGVDYEEVQTAYRGAGRRVRASAHKYGWYVNGMLAAFADEGAFIAHTVALQRMIVENEDYREAVAERFAGAEYDPIAACTNHLFHTHSAQPEVQFRSGTAELLSRLAGAPGVEPVVVTSSLGDKVARNLARLDTGPLRVLGDTREYEIDPLWCPPLPHCGQQIKVDADHEIDLRRRAYHEALEREMEDGSRLVVVADTLSLPGALPMAMGIPFALLRTAYTPEWCAAYVGGHRMGTVVDDLPSVADWALRAE